MCMGTSVFCAALIKVDEALQTLVGFDFPKLKIGVVKTMLDCCEFDDPFKLDGKYSNATLTWIAELRHEKPLIDFSLAAEKLVYRTLIALYKTD